MGKIYEYKSCVTIGDTNLLQNMYFLNHIKLQAIIRELWVKDCVPSYDEDLKNGLILITKNVHCEYKKEYFLYDDIIITMQMTDVHECHMKLIFKYFNEDRGALHADGYQTIYFADKNHKKTPIPENWMKAIEKYHL